MTGLIDPKGGIRRWRNERTMQIQPTILDDVTAEDAVMQEEIFGPIFPILPVDSMAEAEEFIRKREKPLALYLFTQNKALAERFLDMYPLAAAASTIRLSILQQAEWALAALAAAAWAAITERKALKPLAMKRVL